MQLSDNISVQFCICYSKNQLHYSIFPKLGRTILSITKQEPVFIKCILGVQNTMEYSRPLKKNFPRKLIMEIHFSQVQLLRLFIRRASQEPVKMSWRSNK